MDVLIVVDMQEDIPRGDPKHGLAAVAAAIDRLARRVRDRGGAVLFVQHDGTPDVGFLPGTPGWETIAEIERLPGDRGVRKTLNDPFQGTDLEAQIHGLDPERILVCGWATDFCVDATVRSAVSRGFEVVPVAGAHTVCDRPHLPAPQVIAYHEWLWAELLCVKPVRVIPEAEL